MASPKTPEKTTLPVVQAHSVVFKDGGWCLQTADLQGDRVLRTSVSQPNLLAIILNRGFQALNDTKAGR